MAIEYDGYNNEGTLAEDDNFDLDPTKRKRPAAPSPYAAPGAAAPAPRAAPAAAPPPQIPDQPGPPSATPQYTAPVATPSQAPSTDTGEPAPAPPRVTTPETPKPPTVTPVSAYPDSAEGAWNRFIRSTLGEAAWGLGAGQMNQYRGNLGGLVAQFNAANPGAKAKAVGDDKIDFGDGRGPVDVLTAGGQFTYGSSASAMAGGAGGAGGGAGAGAGGPGGYGDPEVYAAIMRLLGRGEKPVTQEDVMAQYAPVSRTLERGAQRTREGSAERLAQLGLNAGGQGGAMDAEVNAINESLGEQQGNVMAQLMTSEMQARRADVVNALGFAQGEEKMKLQLLLAQMDDAIRRMSLSQENTHFYDTMGYNMGRDEAQYNYLMASLMKGA